MLTLMPCPGEGARLSAVPNSDTGQRFTTRNVLHLMSNAENGCENSGLPTPESTHMLRLILPRCDWPSTWPPTGNARYSTYRARVTRSNTPPFKPWCSSTQANSTNCRPGQQTHEHPSPCRQGKKKTVRNVNEVRQDRLSANIGRRQEFGMRSRNMTFYCVESGHELGMSRSPGIPSTRLWHTLNVPLPRAPSKRGLQHV